jgi:hypothetical protein
VRSGMYAFFASRKQARPLASLEFTAPGNNAYSCASETAQHPDCCALTYGCHCSVWWRCVPPSEAVHGHQHARW